MAFGKRKAYVALGVVAVLGFVVICLVPGGSLPVAVIAWFLFGAGTGGTNAMMFSMRADSVDYGEWKTDIRSEGGSYSILSFIRKCGQGIGGAMGAAIIGAFGYVAKAPTRSPDVLHGIRLAAGGAPAVLAVAAVAVMFFYPLTATEHRSLVAELNECRTRRAAGETLGLDAEELGVVQLGDGRSLRLTRSDAPVITLFEREGPGGTEIGSKVAQALDVGFTGQRFSSREISQLDDDVVTPNGFDRFVRSLSCPARRSPHWPRPWRSPQCGLHPAQRPRILPRSGRLFHWDPYSDDYYDLSSRPTWPSTRAAAAPCRPPGPGRIPDRRPSGLAPGRVRGRRGWH
ncbi:MFS transporter [Luteococcus japonicus]|uniref:MFS transporter n=1 Tax=Luteococcus japonicus TaxID=33984 RepID=UPI000B9B2506|nr:MFS transporter [Luteococcus japonicus]